MKLYGTTGQFLSDSAIICGGFNGQNRYYNNGYTKKCFLKKGATSFESITPMTEARQYARSIVTQGHIWITGGLDKNDNKLSSTEFIPKRSTSAPRLPEPVAYHALVSLNETTSILIGGYTNSDSTSSKTHYFDHQSQSWKDGPSLMKGRFEHTAGLITDHVTHAKHLAVVGGYDGYVELDSVELLLSGETQWTKGILSQTFVEPHLSASVSTLISKLHFCCRTRITKKNYAS